MEFLELIVLLVIAFMVLTFFYKVESKKAEVQRQIAQAEADASINKARVWADSKERQASIEARANSYGFTDVPEPEPAAFDINSILRFVGTPEGQKLLENILKPKQ